MHSNTCGNIGIDGLSDKAVEALNGSSSQVEGASQKPAFLNNVQQRSSLETRVAGANEGSRAGHIGSGKCFPV